MNFVEFLPEDNVENIFMYLPTSDLLNATLVHSTWNEYIGSSKKLMKKIKLRLNSKTIKPCSPDEVVQILSESSRKYEHLELTRFRANMSRLLDVFELRHWTSFLLRCKIQEHVGNLLMDKLTEHCTSLTSIDLQFDWLDKVAPFIRANQDLKEVILQGGFETDDIFVELRNMKLEKLMLVVARHYEDHPRVFRPALNECIRAQVDTLKRLKIDFHITCAHMDRATLEMILQMPKLTRLTIEFDSYFMSQYEHFQDVQDNNVVTKLRLILDGNHMSVCGLGELKQNFIEKFRNVKVLRICELHRKVFNFIAETLHSLEEIIIDEEIYMSSDSSAVHAFPNLRRVKFGYAINPLLQQQLQEAAELGNFGRCLLEELQNHEDNEEKFLLLGMKFYCYYRSTNLSSA